MAKVILSMDNQVIEEHQLSKERTTIGRRPHNDIAIDNLAVSGEHAVIVTILNDSFLEDLGSTNGTMVNGSPVKKHFLQNGDTIELGKYSLKFFSETAAKNTASAEEYERTLMVKRTSPDKPAAAPAKPPPRDLSLTQEIPSGLPPAPLEMSQTLSPRAGSLENRAGAVQVLNGGNAGREMDLVKPLTTVGRPGVQVAVLTKRPQGYFITHVEGLTQPMVNGRSIGTEPHALGDHDIIEIAGVKMEFFYR
jgi:pSer/pThr/pTyr-binding forkhead associated (FHA) protein